MNPDPLLIKLRYRGRLRDPQQVYALRQEVEDICQSHGWSYHLWDEDWERPSDLHIEFTGQSLQTEGHAALKGISFYPHEEAELFWLTFEPDGTLHSLLSLNQPDFTGEAGPQDLPWQRIKTGYDGPETHLRLCRLLRYLADRYFAVFEVNDESSFWDHGDEAKFSAWIADVQQKHEKLKAEIAAVEADPHLSAQQRQQRVMQLIYQHSKQFRKPGSS